MPKFEIIPVVRKDKDYKGYPLSEKPFIVEVEGETFSECRKKARALAREACDPAARIGTTFIIISLDDDTEEREKRIKEARDRIEKRHSRYKKGNNE